MFEAPKVPANNRSRAKPKIREAGIKLFLFYLIISLVCGKYLSMNLVISSLYRLFKEIPLRENFFADFMEGAMNADDEKIKTKQDRHFVSA